MRGTPLSLSLVFLRSSPTVSCPDCGRCGTVEDCSLSGGFRCPPRKLAARLWPRLRRYPQARQRCLCMTPDLFEHAPSPSPSPSPCLLYFGTVQYSPVFSSTLRRPDPLSSLGLTATIILDVVYLVNLKHRSASDPIQSHPSLAHSFFMTHRSLVAPCLRRVFFAPRSLCLV